MRLHESQCARKSERELAMESVQQTSDKLSSTEANSDCFDVEEESD